MCGAVSFTARNVRTDFGGCHCEMCRRWAGSALLAVTIPETDMTWAGLDHVATIQSSAWAERGWCKECGTGLWYRVTADGPMKGNYEIPIGILDDANGLVMNSEIFIDCKPDSFTYSGARKTMTRAEVLAKYGVPGDGA